ncbi:hypothetical protein H257_10928 [Aphanomyces astaci]|uniref:Uncharacterized protein n=1 Tax=Aphanomyces astaci TaxID=112090 RepID=W4G4W4_APHAT|nr:hypothetical protein H257_10928 [Aphanomyces astaci]ETV74336.1 hypothetical protein H257_10928 [Aphanomyces astaci]|eukprot:XP_009835994.1 hypothetical protein H257_10928 [Aphanomyces astaci]
MPSPKPIAKRQQRRYVSYHIPEATFRRWVANSSSYLAKKTHGPWATLHGKGRLESVEFSSDLSYHIPEATFRRCVANSSSYLAKKTHGPRATLHGKGRLESVEFSSDLVAFMESVWDGEHFLTTAHLVTWMKSHRPLWLKAYMDGKLNDNSIQEPAPMVPEVREPSWILPSSAVRCQGHPVRASSRTRSILGGVLLKVWAPSTLRVDQRRRNPGVLRHATGQDTGKSSRVKETQKHSDRITVVLSIRANGTKDTS